MKCKPGDMAVVLSAFHRCNVGRFVSVVKLYDANGELNGDWEQPVWLVESTWPLTWTRGRRLWQGKQGPVPDAALQPIRGLPGQDPRSNCLSRPKENLHKPRQCGS